MEDERVLEEHDEEKDETIAPEQEHGPSKPGSLGEEITGRPSRRRRLRPAVRMIARTKQSSRSEEDGLDHHDDPVGAPEMS